MKKCNRCNIEYENDKNFCIKCGSKLVFSDQKYTKIKEGKLVFEEKLKINPFNIEILFEYVKFLTDNSEIKEAVSLLYRIITIDKDNNSAKMLLFKALLDINEYKDALKVGNELLFSTPKDITLLVNLVEISNELEDYENEMIYLNKILQLEPTRVYALSKKASILLELNNIQESIIIYNKLYNLGVKDVLTYFYTGIQKAINSEYNLSIDLLNLGIKEYSKYDIHYFRAVLYLTYCLYETKVSNSLIEHWFTKINFKTLKENYSSSDEEIAVKLVYSLVILKLHEISEFSKIDYLIEECISTCLNKTEAYFTEESNSIIAECWYEIALKQSELSLFDNALDSCQKALALVSSNVKYTNKEKEIQNHINATESKLKKGKLITITSISLTLLLGILSLFLTFKYIENNTWLSLKAQNTISSFKDYLKKYPNGKYANEAKKSIDSLLWANTLILNKYESYKLYMDSSYYRLHAQEADSLEQLVLLQNAKTKKTYEAYQRYIDLFPQGKYAEKTNKIIDEILWKKTLNDATENSYRFYIKRFPFGKYALKAKKVLDDILWSSTENQNNISAFENYKSEFPKGKHIAEANSRIEYCQTIEKRKTDLSWLIGTWSVQTDLGYTYLRISNSRNADSDGESGTYSIDGNILTFRPNSSGYGVTFNIDYESLCLDLGGGYIMRKS